MSITFATRRIPLVLFRSYSVANTPKASINRVAELRKRTDVSLSKAREALIATGDCVEAALDWLQKDLAVSGARKAAKVLDRSAQEGLIGVSILSRGMGPGANAKGVRAAMVELNCETDFVGRNQLFGQLVTDIAHTAAFISEPQGSQSFLRPCSLDMLRDAPLLSPQNTDPHSGSTVGSAINDLIAKVGEKVSLRRAISVVHDPLPPSQSTLGLRVASYLHGTLNTPSQGRIGSLALLALKSSELRALAGSQTFRDDLEKLERSLARQIVGFNTRCIHSSDSKDEKALYNQPFMMLAGGPTEETVRVILERWAKERELTAEASESDNSGIEVLEFVKWTVGEDL
jgi:elongation factor Ts